MPEDSAEFKEAVDARRRRRMRGVDDIPPEWREFVHQYGLNIATALRQCGVQKPRQARHIVETILDEFSPTRGSHSSQGDQTARSVGAFAFLEDR